MGGGIFWVTVIITFASALFTVFLGRGLFGYLVFYLVTETVIWFYSCLWKKISICKSFIVNRLAILIGSIGGYIFGRWCLGDTKPWALHSKPFKNCDEENYWQWLL